VWNTPFGRLLGFLPLRVNADFLFYRTLIVGKLSYA